MTFQDVSTALGCPAGPSCICIAPPKTKQELSEMLLQTKVAAASAVMKRNCSMPKPFCAKSPQCPHRQLPTRRLFRLLPLHMCLRAAPVAETVSLRDSGVSQLRRAAERDFLIEQQIRMHAHVQAKAMFALAAISQSRAQSDSCRISCCLVFTSGGSSSSSSRRRVRGRSRSRSRSRIVVVVVSSRGRGKLFLFGIATERLCIKLLGDYNFQAPVLQFPRLLFGIKLLGYRNFQAPVLGQAI